MTSIFQHILGYEQIRDNSISTSLLEDGAATVQKMNINGNLDFHEFQALDFRIENLSLTPTAGNPGRLIWNTVAQEVLVDTGGAFLALAINGISIVNYIVGEDLSSQVGGVTFILANVPILNKEEIFFNGVGLRRGIGNDYTISGAIITMNFTPEVDSVITANYVKV